MTDSTVDGALQRLEEFLSSSRSPSSEPMLEADIRRVCDVVRRRKREPEGPLPQISQLLAALDRVQTGISRTKMPAVDLLKGGLTEIADIDLVCRHLRLRLEATITPFDNAEEVEIALACANSAKHNSPRHARILATEVRRLRQRLVRDIIGPEVVREEMSARPNSPHFYARKLRAHAANRHGLFSAEDVGILNASAAELEKVGDVSAVPYLSKDVKHALATVEQYLESLGHDKLPPGHLAAMKILTEHVKIVPLHIAGDRDALLEYAAMHLAIYRAMGFEDVTDGLAMQECILEGIRTNDAIADRVVKSELQGNALREERDYLRSRIVAETACSTARLRMLKVIAQMLLIDDEGWLLEAEEPRAVTALHGQIIAEIRSIKEKGQAMGREVERLNTVLRRARQALDGEPRDDGDQTERETAGAFIARGGKATPGMVLTPDSVTEVTGKHVRLTRMSMRPSAEAVSLMDAEPVNADEEHAQEYLDNLDGEKGPLQGEG